MNGTWTQSCIRGKDTNLALILFFQVSYVGFDVGDLSGLSVDLVLQPIDALIVTRLPADC